MPPLQWQTFPVRFTEGLDLKTDEKYLNSRLVNLENARLTSPYRVEKRFGHTALAQTTAAGSIAAGRQLFTSENRLLLNDGEKTYGYSASIDEWREFGDHLIGQSYIDEIPTPSSVSLTARTSVSANYFDTALVKASTTGRSFLLCRSSTAGSGNGIFWIVDIDSKTIIAEQAVTGLSGDTAADAMAVVAGERRAYAVWREVSGSGPYTYTLKYREFDSQTPANGFGAEQSLFTQAPAGALEDDSTVFGVDRIKLVHISADTFALAYRDATNAANVVLRPFPGSGTSATLAMTKYGAESFQLTRLPTSGAFVLPFFDNVSVGNYDIRAHVVGSDFVRDTHADGDKLLDDADLDNTAYNNARTASRVSFSGDHFTVIPKSSTVATVVAFAVTGSGRHLVANDYTVPTSAGAAVDYSANDFDFLETGELSSSEEGVLSLGFHYAGSPLLATKFPTAGGAGERVLLWRTSDKTLVGGWDLDALAFAKQMVRSAGSVIDGALQTPSVATSPLFGLSVVETPLLLGNDIITRVRALRVDFSERVPWVEADGVLFVGGASLKQIVDGVVSDAAFAYSPEPATFASTGTGGTLGAGTYQTATMYRRIDEALRQHLSAFAFGNQVVIGAGSTNRLTMTGKSYLFREPPDVYHVALNTDAGGSVVYREHQNRLNGDTTFSFDENWGDENTYVNNEAQNDAVFAVRSMVTFDNRLWVLTEQGRIRYSKAFDDDEGVAFPLAFEFFPQSNLGDPTAIAVLDEKLVVFYERGISYVTGSGPNDLGQGAYAPDVAIATDVGLPRDELQSVVEVDGAVYFRSAKGFHRLTRQLQLDPVGDPVDAFNGTPLLAGALAPHATEIHWLLSGGTVLVYDYRRGQWMQDTGFPTAVDIVPWNETLALLRSTGEVIVESSTVWQDDETDYSMIIETGFTFFDEISNMKRVRRLFLQGVFYDEAVITADITYLGGDDPDNTTQQEVINTTTALVGNDDEAFFEIELAQHRCRAIKVKLTIAVDAANKAANSRAVAINQIAFELGIEGRNRGLPSQKVF